MNLPKPLAILNPSVASPVPAYAAPAAGRAPGIVNSWHIRVGERPAVQGGLLPPFPYFFESEDSIR